MSGPFWNESGELTQEKEFSAFAIDTKNKPTTKNDKANRNPMSLCIKHPFDNQSNYRIFHDDKQLAC